MRNIFHKIVHETINLRNRMRLRNQCPTIICSQCTGGFIYHWLKLQFRSPFINLWLDNESFVTLLENWGKVDFSDIQELRNHEKPYPIGITRWGG